MTQEPNEVTLDVLRAQGRLRVDPPAGGYRVPGTESEQAALGYLHANCGHCHASSGFMGVWLDPNTLDSTVQDVNSYRNLVNQISSYGFPYVTLGDLDDSFIYWRMRVRGGALPEGDALPSHYGANGQPSFGQMPPLGTEDVDIQGSEIIAQWIRGEPEPPAPSVSLLHVSSGKCVHPRGGSANPRNGTKAVLHDGCNQSRLQFELTAAGSLRHVASGKCLHPFGGATNPSNGTKVIFHELCDLPRLRFEITRGGSLRHVSSRKCIHPQGGSSQPSNNTDLVFHSACDQNDFVLTSLRRSNPELRSRPALGTRAPSMTATSPAGAMTVVDSRARPPTSVALPDWASGSRTAALSTAPAPSGVGGATPRAKRSHRPISDPWFRSRPQVSIPARWSRPVPYAAGEVTITVRQARLLVSVASFKSAPASIIAAPSMTPDSSRVGAATVLASPRRRRIWAGSSSFSRGRTTTALSMTGASSPAGDLMIQGKRAHPPTLVRSHRSRWAETTSAPPTMPAKSLVGGARLR